MKLSSLTPTELETHADALLAMQHAAYAVEAAVIGDDRIPPLHEGRQDLLDAGLDWLIATRDQELAGALGYTVADGALDIDRLMVAPAAFRNGVGRALVEEALRLAPRAVVATGRDNTPARAFYSTLGFRHRGDAEVLPGLWISRYESP